MRRLSIPCLPMLLVACASTGGGEGSRSDGPLTRPDLAAVSASNAYDALEQLRPLWLRPLSTRGTQGQPVGIVIGGRAGGTFDDLRSVDLADVERIEFMNRTTAMNRYGTTHGSAYNGGAIIVSLRNQELHSRPD